MKTILLETVSIIEVLLFWALALPAAALIFPALAGWQILASLVASHEPSHGGMKGFGARLRA